MAWAAAIPAGMSAIQGFMNMGQGNDQMALAMAQLQLQRQIARRQYELATAGTRDARGNETVYVPGLGWRVNPTDMTRRLLGATDREEFSRMTEDADRTRRGKRSNEERRFNEANLADVLMRQIRGGVGNVSEETVRNRAVDVGSAAINDKADFAKNAAGLVAMRSGNTSGDIAGKIDAQSREGLRSVLAKARAGAQNEANATNTNNMKVRSDPYNLYASRASNVEDAPFQPTNIEAAATGLLAQSMKSAPYHLAGASNALGTGLAGAMAGYEAQRRSQPNMGAMGTAFASWLEDLMNPRNRSSGQSAFAGAGGGASGSIF